MRTLVVISVGVVVAVLLLLGCPKQQPPAPPQKPVEQGQPLVGLPIKVTVNQRTTTGVPGSGGALNITIDDVTRGQVMLSLADKEGSPVLGPTSLSTGQSAEFKLGGRPYLATLEKLDNELVGDDAATFVISAPADSTDKQPEVSAANAGSGEDAERVKIGRLIEHIGSLEGAVFIRNGTEHTPAEAAEHLRRKWEAAGTKIATAEEFVKEIASKSSTSGEPYHIRTKEGVTKDASAYLLERLKRVEQGN
jgi:hypothetical protein